MKHAKFYTYLGACTAAYDFDFESDLYKAGYVAALEELRRAIRMKSKHRNAYFAERGTDLLKRIECQ